ncbi:hypothetical protein IJ101_02550 [Candidatus Saccharibacteria bacterium]|nr:hypothetical protein [Candidatus Saccharibacteria bacterium]
MSRKNVFELSARQMGIVICDAECDEMAFDEGERYEAYKTLFDLSGNHRNLRMLKRIAGAIVSGSSSVRVFGIVVAENGEILINASMEDMPESAFSYPVRRDCSSEFTAIYRPDAKNEFKFRFETSYKMTRITCYAKNSKKEWEEKNRLVVWPNGNSQLVEIKQQFAH